MKLGQKVIIKELNEEAVVTSVNAAGVAESVKIIDTGEIVSTLNYTIQKIRTNLITFVAFKN
jgi:hypothetical protein